MLLEHQGKRPHIHETAYIAPTATVCGDVTIGAESRVLFGAVLVAEGGPVTIGGHCIIMEQAVLRGSARHPVRLADHVLVGPHAHLSGCIVEDSVFIATGACIFNGARLDARSEVRINGVVHVNTAVPAGATVPIDWVAVGDLRRFSRPTSTSASGRCRRRSSFPAPSSAWPARRRASPSCPR